MCAHCLTSVTQSSPFIYTSTVAKSEHIIQSRGNVSLNHVCHSLVTETFPKFHFLAGYTTDYFKRVINGGLLFIFFFFIENFWLQRPYQNYPVYKLRIFFTL